MKINLNDNVRVKLTKKGLLVLMEQHEELMSIFPERARYHFRTPETDRDGWTKFQLWSLMQKFGKHIGMGFDPVFETEIEIVE